MNLSNRILTLLTEEDHETKPEDYTQASYVFDRTFNNGDYIRTKKGFKVVYRIYDETSHEIKIDNDHIWAFSRNGIDWKLVKGRLQYKDIEDRPIDVAKLIGKLADEGGE